MLLLIYPLRRLLVHDDGHVSIISNRKLAVLHLLAVPSLACWWWPSQHGRLLLVVLGAAAGSVSLAVSWGRAWESNPSTLPSKVTSSLTALVITMAFKYLNHSNHPGWVFLNETNGGMNLTILIVTVVSILQVYGRPADKASAFRTRPQRSWFASIRAACGLGALLFALPTYLSDSGTMIAWTWTGYPITGPMALSHGWIILSAAGAGVLIQQHKPMLGRHPAFYAVGCAAFYILLKGHDWSGFAAAVVIAIWLPVTALPIIDDAMQFKTIHIHAAGWLVGSLLLFIQVLAVAYAFVPVVGPLMREKTWLVLCIQQLLIALSLFWPTAKIMPAPVRASGTPEQVWASGLQRKLVGATVGFVALSSLVIPFARKVHISAPSHSQERLVTAGIHTVHFGLDQNMYDSTRRLSSIYKEMDLDIVGLLETDLHRSVFGNRDLTQWLAEELGMYADIGPAPKYHTWGAILLSRFPIINSTHHLLPSPVGELAPAIEAWVDLYGVPTQIIVSHNGQEEDARDRELQTTRLAELFSRAWPSPALFLGYVVTKPHAPRPSPYKILFEDGRIQDVDPTDPDRWCQYIGFRALERVGYVRVSRYTVSDTEIQTIKLRIPPVGYLLDPDRDPRPTKMSNETLPLSWQYPFHFYAPTAMVYNQHMYFPRYLPDYFAVDKFASYDQWSPQWHPPQQERLD